MASRHTADRTDWGLFGPLPTRSDAFISARNKDEIFEATGCVGATRDRGRKSKGGNKYVAVTGPTDKLRAGMAKAKEIIERNHAGNRFVFHPRANISS